jgi:hypothetical protein
MNGVSRCALKWVCDDNSWTAGCTTHLVELAHNSMCQKLSPPERYYSTIRDRCQKRLPELGA